MAEQIREEFGQMVEAGGEPNPYVNTPGLSAPRLGGGHLGSISQS